MSRVAYCRQCKRRLIFATTINGKSMPLDPTPNPDGNVAVSRDEHGALNARVLVRKHPDATLIPGKGEDIYMPHHASCPARPVPPVKAVTDSNAGQVARRRPRFETDSLFAEGELPENVIRLRGRSEHPG